MGSGVDVLSDHDVIDHVGALLDMMTTEPSSPGVVFGLPPGNRIAGAMVRSKSHRMAQAMG